MSDPVAGNVPTHALGRLYLSPDIADAAQEVTGRRAHMTNDIRMLVGERLIGPAMTLRFVPGA